MLFKKIVGVETEKEIRVLRVGMDMVYYCLKLVIYFTCGSRLRRFISFRHSDGFQFIIFCMTLLNV